MAQFTNVTYTGSYSGSGSGVDSEVGAFTITTSGSLTATLSKDTAGNVSGSWIYSGTAIVTSAEGTDSGPITDAGGVSGTSDRLIFVSNSGVFVNGIGSLSNNDTSLSMTASFAFDGAQGSAGGAMAGSPGSTPGSDTPATPDVSQITFTNPAPTVTQWTDSSTVQASSVFVSPQYVVDDVSGAWSLKSYPGTPGGAYATADVANFSGASKEKLVEMASRGAQEYVDDLIKDELGEEHGKALSSLFQSASAAKSYYEAVSKLAKNTMQVVVDAPEAIVGLRSPDEIEQRISSIRLEFAEDLAKILLPDYVGDVIDAVKWFLKRSEYTFGLQGGNSAYFGDDHRDTMIGGQSGDAFFGGANQDLAFGLGGNDTLKGEGGNDYLYGGAGVDTAVFNGKRGDFTVTRSTNAHTVTAKAGTDGTDVLGNIERLRFSDMCVAFDTEGAAGQMYRLYQAAFNRKPDLAGLGYWIDAADKGTSITSAATSFIASPEFQTLYGASLGNADFVTQLYSNVLHRAPDAGGKAYWVSALEGNMSRAQVLASFSESPENKASLILDSAGTAAQVYRLYKAAFDRVADTSGLTYWIARMEQGQSLNSVANGFMASAEFTAMYGANASNTSFITQLYNNVLDRAPDTQGLDWWVGKLDSGQSSRSDVLTGFSESPENKASLVGVIGDGIEYIPLS